MTGGDLVARALIEQGVSTVFGIPGALNAHLYDALGRHERELRHILVRHELGGAWMADGFARASGDAGVALTVPGPGATHSLSAVAGAYTDCSPLLLISSQSERAWRGELRRDLFHGLDQQRIFAPITRWQASVRDAGELPGVLHEAFVRLRSGRPGPVHLEIPADVFGQAAPDEVPSFVDRARADAPTGDVQAILESLRSASRALILAGDGVLHSGASEALGRVAARLQAPVITTVQGKSALPDAHPWSLGDMTSPAGMEAYGRADLLLAIGVRFVQTDTRWPFFTPPRRLVHIDADGREIGRVFPAEIGVVADPRTVLDQLEAASGEPHSGARGGWSGDFERLRALNAAHPPLPLLQALRSALPSTGQVAFDVCFAGFRSRTDWVTCFPRDYSYPGVYVGMGFGLPAGMGARLARPDCPTLVVSGDAGFQMTMAELGTAVQAEIPVVVVVVNDGGLTLIRRVQDRDFGGRRVAVDLVNPSFPDLARAYGLEASSTSDLDELQAATRRALEQSRPALIEFIPPDE